MVSGVTYLAGKFVTVPLTQFPHPPNHLRRLIWHSRHARLWLAAPRTVSMVTEPTDTVVRGVDVIVVLRSSVPRNVATASHTARTDAGFVAVLVCLSLRLLLLELFSFTVFWFILSFSFIRRRCLALPTCVCFTCWIHLYCEQNHSRDEFNM